MQMNQNLLDDRPLVDDTDNLHLVAAVFTDQRIDFPDLFDTFPQDQWRYSSRFAWWEGGKGRGPLLTFDTIFSQTRVILPDVCPLLQATLSSERDSKFVNNAR